MYPALISLSLLFWHFHDTSEGGQPISVVRIVVIGVAVIVDFAEVISLFLVSYGRPLPPVVCRAGTS